jgi:hypothetical protein
MQSATYHDGPIPCEHLPAAATASAAVLLAFVLHIADCLPLFFTCVQHSTVRSSLTPLNVGAKCLTIQETLCSNRGPEDGRPYVFHAFLSPSTEILTYLVD